MKRALGGCIAASLMFGSTASFAAAPAPVGQVDPWAVLTAMYGGPSAAVMWGSAASAAAAATSVGQAPQGCVLPVVDVAPPPVPQPPPPPPPGISPLFLGLAAIAAAAGIYLAFHLSNHANSPA